MRVISSGRLQRAVPIDLAAQVALTDPAEATLVIWTARLRTGHVVIFQASGSRAFRAAASIAATAVVELVAAATDSVVAGDLGAVALAALEDLAVAGSGADAEN